MQTQLPNSFLTTHEGQLADSILRSCVHCGFCNAACPTYQLLGNELDGPRGRIYQIKNMLEGQQPSKRTQLHLDRCLTCRSCETTCPSGVRYSQLLEIGRNILEVKVERSLLSKLMRRSLRLVLPYPQRFKFLLSIGLFVKPVLPHFLKKQFPMIEKKHQWDEKRHKKKLLVLDGCVQSVATPDTNAIASKVFSKLGYQIIHTKKAGCCGALSTHLSAVDEGKDFMRRNIDAWWPHIEEGVEGILATASGCGVMLSEYGQALSNDKAYAEKANEIVRLFKDPIEILKAEDLSELEISHTKNKIAFHSPCTQQHGLNLQGEVETLLTDLGFNLVNVADSHLCCGSAGTYSILQSELSTMLLKNKLAALNDEQPDLIVTANVGCQLHLQADSDVPVRHWLSLLI